MGGDQAIRTLGILSDVNTSIVVEMWWLPLNARMTACLSCTTIPGSICVGLSGAGCSNVEIIFSTR